MDRAGETTKQLQGTAREQVEAKGASNRDKGQAGPKKRGSYRLKGTI